MRDNSDVEVPAAEQLASQTGSKFLSLEAETTLRRGKEKVIIVVCALLVIFVAA